MSSNIGGSHFEWRVSTGAWRWLLLGSLGLGASAACSGRAEDSPGTLESDLQSKSKSAAISACEDPVALGGGWERCANGVIHRATVNGECTSVLPRPEPASARSASGRGGSCQYDEDCTAAPHGYCDDLGFLAGFVCQYGCVSDADCNAGEVCVCGEPVGMCRPSACTTDSDCDEGLCANFTADPGCPSEQFACQTLEDECATDADCAEGRTCTITDWTPSGARTCGEVECTVGRPLLIEGEARLARSVERDDWYPRDARPSSVHAALAPDVREAAARGWLAQALMEHASIAAFARFTLQLLGLGAPAELVAASTRAQADELEHAAACFELARRYAGRDVGPGPLELGGVLGSVELEAVVLDTIAEGCIGETVAALEAAEALARCTDAPTRAVLERIARDETRHAELAWRFVAWALATGPAELHERVRAAFAEAAAPRGAVAPDVGAFEHELARTGIIAEALRPSLRERALREVIAPCAAALLAEGVTRATSVALRAAAESHA